MSHLIRAAWLTTIWVALWSDLSVANVVGGLVVSVVILASFDTWTGGRHVLRQVAVLRFGAYFLLQLVVSSVVVAATVVAPRDRIRSGIVAVPLSGCSDAVATLVATAISLTPGTLTLEVRRDPLTLYVHVLHVRDVDATRRDVLTLEALAVRAFGDADAIAGLATDATTRIWRSR